MILEEAKKKLREWIKCEEVTIRTEEGDIEVYQERLELFKFVLNYIENESIPKEKVKKLQYFYLGEANTRMLELVPTMNVFRNLGKLLEE